MAQLIYCAAAAQAEIKRTLPWKRREKLVEQRSLGLVPVVDGKCPYCNRDIKTTT